MDIYEKWQKRWEESRLFEADPDNRPKVFVNGAYPYVNGRPHLGHYFSTFLRPDVYARFKRMKGYNVLYPQGFHATGQPIAAAARRLREGDPLTKKILLMSGVPEEEIERFKDPYYWIRYFMGLWIHDLKKAGNSIDWRRTFHTTELNPAYDKFIKWQYRKLKELGYVKRGRYPVVWCPREEIPIADHDRAEGEGVMPEEVVAIKFPLGDTYLVAVTYRPETVYGVTNLWVNPDAVYVEVKVKDERWIVAKEAYERLRHQVEMESVKEIKGSDLVGKRVAVPVDGREVPILPASFVDPAFGTGIVMSVPAHAPYDWVALEEIKARAQELGIDPSELEPIPLIRVEGLSEFPARDIVEKYGIRTQEEREKLDKATKELYKKEFYEGVLNDKFGDLVGKKVAEAKDEIVKRLVGAGYATKLYVLPERVVCRCGAEGVVKIVDQWFLDYANPEWKKKAREAAEQTVFTPEDARPAVYHTIEWLREWPLTRDVRTSLGTRLPWDESQYIESLSDSTIYMAYYTIAKWLEHPEEFGIDVGKLNDAFFDYVFFGKGTPEEVSRETGIPVEMLKEMREEFLYWYPTDVRFVGKDLIQNHLTFTIFHHAAVLPGLHPRRWSTAGHVTVDKQKMSKSKANFINLIDVVEKYGADPVRFAVAMAGNTTLDDANIETEIMEKMRRELPEWLEFVEKMYDSGEEIEGRFADKWFAAEISRLIKEAEKAYEELRLRDAAITIWNGFWRAFKKYLEITDNKPSRKEIRWALESWIKVIQPVMPHYAEEAWERIGKEPFVSVAPWPEVEDVETKYIDLVEYVERVIEDIEHVKRLFKGGEPKKVTIYVAEPWKYEVFRKVKELLPTRDMGKIMAAVPSEHRGEVAPIVQKALRDPSKLPDVVGTREEEVAVLRELKGYIEKKTELSVEIRDAPIEGKTSLPFRPALVVT